MKTQNNSSRYGVGLLLMTGVLAFTGCSSFSPQVSHVPATPTTPQSISHSLASTSYLESHFGGGPATTPASTVGFATYSSPPAPRPAFRSGSC